VRGDQREGRTADDARGRRRPPLPGDLSAQPVTVKLLDDHEVDVRPIRAEDRDALAEAFERLSEQSRYQRFLTTMRELSEGELRYLTEVDHHDHEAVIAFEHDGRAVGVARFVRAAGTERAEAAVTVIDEWQGRGLGTALTALIADRAREEGIKCFTALLLASNRQVRDMFQSLGPTRTVSHEAGLVEIEVDVPAEGIGEMAGLLRTVAGGEVELATPPWGLRPATE
jgi:GNAT superfamily N-acetyltransferase